MSWKQAAWLSVIIGMAVIFPGLCIQQLESGDETRVAGIAAEMFVGGDSLIPRLNGTPFLEYPPLFYWSISLCYAVFGITDFAAKLPSALCALGCVLLVFAFARKMKYPVWCALLASVMLITCAQFFGNSRKCMADMMLAFFILLAVYQFYCLAVPTDRRWRFPIRFGLFIIGLAGGIYTKGLIGVCIPLAVLGSWLAVGNSMERRIAWREYAVLVSGTVLALGLAGIWYFLIFRSGGQQIFHTAFFVNNFGRFSGSQGDHAESFLYYFIKLPTLFFPWLILLPFAIWRSGRRVWRFHDRDALLLLCFLLVPFAALCCASGKRVVYLLPLYAPCALLCGRFLYDPPSRVSVVMRQLRREYPRIFCFAAYRYGGLILISGFIAADTAYAFYSSRKNSLRPLFEECAMLEKNGKVIVLGNASERIRGAAFFYLHHPLEEKKLADGMSPGEYWILRSKKQALPGKRFADSHYLLDGEKK